jgi:hypothetical protein
MEKARQKRYSIKEQDRQKASLPPRPTPWRAITDAYLLAIGLEIKRSRLKKIAFKYKHLSCQRLMIYVSPGPAPTVSPCNRGNRSGRATAAV